jgi:hypothetical protein
MKARENPFASDRVESLGFRFPPRLSFPKLLERLKEQHNVGAIVGRHGSGKTRLLEELFPHLQEAGYQPQLFRLSSESGMRDKERMVAELRKVVKPGFILLDGAEQLTTRLWLPLRAAASQAAGFVVTVHRVSRLPMLIECETNEALLQDLVEELCGAPLMPFDAENLMLRHHGNLRDCFRELYDRWAGDEVEEDAVTE